MVTYVRLALQDLTTQKAPVLFQLSLKYGCFLRDPPNQWQETAIPCGTAVTSAGLLPCCWSRLKHAHPALPADIQMEFKSQPLNLSCWKKEEPPSCRASEQARSVDFAVAGTFCLERESEKNVKLRILGNFLSWEGLGSTWPPKPQAPGGAHLGDKGFGKPVGTPACSCSHPLPGERSRREGCQQMSGAFMGWFQPPLGCLQIQDMASVYCVNVWPFCSTFAVFSQGGIA